MVVAVTSTVTVDTATYEVKDQSGTVVESGTCTIAGAVVFFLADMTKAGYVLGQYYYAYFTVTIAGMSKVIKDKVGFMVTE